MNWQVETQGQIYEADFEELKQWIVEGAVLSSDKVKRGNLRWLTVEKVPELYKYFESDDFVFEPSEVFAADLGVAADSAKAVETLSETEDSGEEAVWEINGEKLCYLHKTVEAVYACVICKKLLCKMCPDSYGGKVKICPLCGSLCRSADERLDDESKSIGAINKPYYKPDEALANLKSQKRLKFRLADLLKTFTSKLRHAKASFSKLPFVIISRWTKKPR